MNKRQKKNRERERRHGKETLRNAGTTDVKRRGELFASIERQSVNEDARTAEVAFSSETPVQDRFFGPPTVLLHEARAMDLAPLRNVGAALLNHDPERIVGAITDVRLDADDRVGRATIRFDDDDDGNRAFAKVLSGSLRGVSVRFVAQRTQMVDEGNTWESPGKRSFSGPLEIATRWAPREISLTPIPADVNVGVGRQDDGDEPGRKFMNFAKIKADLIARGLITDSATDDEVWAAYGRDQAERMAEPTNDPPADNSPEADVETTGSVGGVRYATTTGNDAAATLAITGNTFFTPSDDSARQDVIQHFGGLRQIANLIDRPELAGEWLERNLTLEEATAEASRLRSENAPPLQQVGSAVESVGETGVERYSRAIEQHILRRGQRPYEANDCTEVAADTPLVECIRRWMMLHGNRGVASLSRPGVVSALQGMRSFPHSTSDFANILENVMNKSMQIAADEVLTTWRPWTSRGTLQDFKLASRTKFGALGNFVENQELEPVTETTVADGKETWQLKTYARRFGISRQALINDDLDAFVDLPRKFGQAYDRTINSLVYTELENNPVTTEDAAALFATTHTSGSNLVTSGSGAPTAARIGALVELMAAQQEISGNATLNLRPSFLLHPIELWTEVTQLYGAIAPTQTSNVVAPFLAGVTPIGEPALTDATAWYIIGSPSNMDTITVGFLAGGGETPFLERQDGAGILGTSWIAYGDVAVRATEHRNMVRDDGVA